jgi:hypothetical protein
MGTALTSEQTSHAHNSRGINPNAIELMDAGLKAIAARWRADARLALFQMNTACG